jgi:hypothetical protein
VGDLNINNSSSSVAIRIEIEKEVFACVHLFIRKETEKSA